jgi:putative addiction module component (TIGR02574 family)
MHKMISNLNTLPIEQRIQLVEDLWDSIAEEKASLPISQDQKDELDFRLKAYSLDKNQGKEAKLLFSEIRKNL